MKTKIYTYNFTSNYGALLQAFGLGNYIKSLTNSEVNYSYYHPLKFRYYEFLRPMITKKPNKFFGHLKKNIKILNWRNDNIKKLEDSFNQTMKENEFSIYGSDEIWNYSNSIVKIDLAYYGIGIKAEKKIAFAASCGSLDKDSEVPGTIQKGWRSLSSISVRDENSRDLVARFVENPIDIALDPTFLFDFSPYEKNCLKENFILVYTTGFSSELQQKVKDYAKAKGKKLISIGYADTFCDENIIGIGPFEFLGYFKAASEVITNTLHGTIFAVKYNKPLAIISDSYRQNKLASIIEICELEEKILPVCGFGLEKCLSTSPDYIRINRKISMSAKSSKEFLKSALE